MNSYEKLIQNLKNQGMNEEAEFVTDLFDSIKPILEYNDEYGNGFDALEQLMNGMPTEKELWMKWVSLIEFLKASTINE